MSEKRYFHKLIVDFFTTSYIALIIVSLLFLIVPNAHAATGNMYFSPSTANVNNGANITLNLRLNPGTAVQGVTATVNFDSTRLQYVSVSYAGSPFDLKAVETIGSSSIRIERAIINPAGYGSDALIAAITFKALPYSGTSTVTLSGANAAYNGVYTDPTLGSATITFRPGSCPSGQTGTPPNCKPTSSTPKPTTPTPTTPSTPSQPSSPAPTTKLDQPMLVEEVVQYTIARFVVKTNQSAQVFVKYGLSEDRLDFQTPLTAAGTNHTVRITDNLPPSTDIFYVIVAQSGATSAQTDVIRTRMKGVPVRVALLDKKLSPLRNQEVTLQPLGLKVKTDGSGFFTSTDIPPGDFTLEFSRDGQKHAQYLHITASIETADDTQTAQNQVRALVYDTYEAAAWDLGTIARWAAIVLGTFVFASVVLYLIRNRRLGFTRFRGKFKHASAKKDPGIIVGGTAKTETVQPAAAKLANFSHPSTPAELSQSLGGGSPKIITPSAPNWKNKDGV